MNPNIVVWTEAEIETLRSLYPTTPASEIARRLGRPVGGVRVKAERLGLQKREPWTAEQLDLLRSLFPTTPGYLVAERVGHPLHSVYGKAKELGLGKTVHIRRVKPWPADRVSGNRKYTINEMAFVHLTQPTAYALGFFVADGNLADSRGDLCFSNTDRDILGKIRDALGSTYPVRTYTRECNQTIHVLDINSKPLYDSLVALGLTPRKSLIVRLPPIPDELFFPFLRGYFDGDGHCTHSKRKGLVLGFTSGSLAFLSDLAERIEGLLGLPRPRVYTGTARHFSYLGPAALAIADAMHADAGDLFMPRKREPVERYRAGRQFRRRRNAWERVGCTEKWCNRCKAVKPRADFNLCTTKPDGLDGYCRECMSRIGRERRKQQQQ